MTKAVTGPACVAVVDCSGADGGIPYCTVEWYVADDDGWTGAGYAGPADSELDEVGGDGVVGTSEGDLVYTYGRSSSSPVRVRFRSEELECPTGIDGWWVFVALVEDATDETPSVVA